MKIDFTDKNALVTGSSRGIGKQIADDMEELGAYVYRTDTETLNFLDKQSVMDYIQYIDSELTELDILVNNAGINKKGNIIDYTEPDFDDMVNVNLKGVFTLSNVIAYDMMMNRKGGKIVNISSIYGSTSDYGRSIYSMTKAGVEGLTRGMALDLAEHNILVNSVSPGFTMTDLTRQNLNDDELKAKESMVPLGRIAEPSDISNVVCFLCSDLNMYLTGQNILVDGGYVIR